MIHQAAAYLDTGVQYCARCGVVLVDYRHVYVAPHATMRWWPTLAAIEVAGACPQEQIETDRHPNCPVKVPRPPSPPRDPDDDQPSLEQIRMTIAPQSRWDSVGDD